MQLLSSGAGVGGLVGLRVGLLVGGGVGATTGLGVGRLVGLTVGGRDGLRVGILFAVTSQVMLAEFKKDKMLSSEDWLKPSAALLIFGSITWR